MTRRQKAIEALEVLRSLGYENLKTLISDNPFISRIQKDVARVENSKDISKYGETYFNLSLLNLQRFVER